MSAAVCIVRYNRWVRFRIVTIPRTGSMRLDTKELGVAVVGSGRIGALRARMAAAHAAVKFLAVSDIDAERAQRLAQLAGANVHSGDNDDVIGHPQVNAVIVSTSEHEHLAPVMRALELGKPVLVEKPIALTLDDADRIIAQAERTGTPIRVCYAQRRRNARMAGSSRARSPVPDGDGARGAADARDHAGDRRIGAHRRAGTLCRLMPAQALAIRPAAIERRSFILEQESQCTL